MNNNKKQSKAGEIATMTGIAAASVAAYLLLGPDGKKNRKTAEAWGNKMKKEVVDNMKKAKKLSGPVYHEIVDKVSKKYGNLKNIDKKDLAPVLSELRKSWDHIVKAKNSAVKIKPKTKTKAKK